MRTLAGPARIETEVKRSRFVARAARVDNQADTPAFFESVADTAATHNCWAWKIGQEYRFNDDGEPASTAGRPILAAIEGKELDHVMVVVTRFFGGIKLGAGGLVRAYGGAAARCLDAADLVIVQPRVHCIVQTGFKWTGELYAALESCGATKEEEQFEPDGVRVRASLPAARYEDLCSTLRDATRGGARVRQVDS